MKNLKDKILVNESNNISNELLNNVKNNKSGIIKEIKNYLNFMKDYDSEYVLDIKTTIKNKKIGYNYLIGDLIGELKSMRKEYEANNSEIKNLLIDLSESNISSIIDKKFTNEDKLGIILQEYIEEAL